MDNLKIFAKRFSKSIQRRFTNRTVAFKGVTVAPDLALKHEESNIKAKQQRGADPESTNARLTSDRMRDLFDYEHHKRKYCLPTVAPGETRLDNALRNGPNSRAKKKARDLLQYERRKSKLYPPTVAPDETRLDDALRNGLNSRARKKATKLLSEKNCGKSIEQVWNESVTNHQKDIQRAILLLKADQSPCFRLEEKAAVTDRRIAKLMKEIPYYSPKRSELHQFNGAVCFDSSEENIVCRHLATHQQLQQKLNNDLKFDYAQFADTNAIRANVPFEIDKTIEHLLVQATETHLFHNRDFGKLLVKQFMKMKTENETNRLILLSSINHMMNLTLKIKEKDGKPYYVATLFDPNITTSHIRVASDNMSTFEALALKNFIKSKYHYNWYYQAKEISLIFVHPKKKTTSFSAQAVNNRTLTSSIEDKDIDATAIHFILANGFAGELRRLKRIIENRPKSEILRLLFSRNYAGFPGLFVALQDGHANTIKAFSELLKLVPCRERAELVAAKFTDGTPGLLMALLRGHAEAVKNFSELLKLVPLRKRAGLVAAKSTDGTPGLFESLLNGHAEAVKAFGKLLILVPPDARAELIAAKNAEGFPGLLMALQNGHAEAVKAFGELLILVPPDARAELISAKLEGHPGLFEALLNGHAETVKAFGELLILVPPEARAELIAAKNAEGLPGLLMALHNGHAEAVKAFGEMLILAPPDARAELIAAKLEGHPGLFEALLNGHAEAVKAFGELLILVPPDARAELIAAENAKGLPGLLLALQNGHAEAVKAFGELLKLVPPERRAELIAAEEADGYLYPKFFAARQNGTAGAVKAFDELIELVHARRQMS